MVAELPTCAGDRFDQVVGKVRAGLPPSISPEMLDAFLTDHREQLVALLETRQRTIWYASGANVVSEIVGFAEAGQAIGVSALHVSREAEAALRKYAADVPVFLDSGAYSEVAFATDGPPKVVAPIEDAGWEKILGLAERLAPVCKRLAVVAPDRVGDQDVTLQRLARYRDRIRGISHYGAEILVPLQKGALSLAAFDQRVQGVLVGIKYTPAIPGSKHAVTPAELREYVAARRPKRMHLLGIGGRNRHLRELLAAICEGSPGIRLSIDSNRIAAAVGRKSGLRPLTAAEDDAAAELAQRMWGEGGDEVLGHGRLEDYTDTVGQPSEWLSKRQRREVARNAGLTKAEIVRFVRDPDALLAELYDEEREAWLVATLDAAWAERHRRITAGEKRRRAIVETFGDKAAKLSKRLRLVPAEVADVNAYVTERHYLHRGRTMAQVGYWAVLDAPEGLRGTVDVAPPGKPWRVGGHPIAGAILFALPRVSKRIGGYHPMEMVELARLFLEPDENGKNPPHLASTVMGQAFRRIARDWHDAYPRLPRPRAILSYADTTRHEGTVYKAAGFIAHGGTRPGGRSRTRADGPEHEDLQNPKTRYLLPLEPPDAESGYAIRAVVSGVSTQRTFDALCEAAEYAAGVADIYLPPASQRCLFTPPLYGGKFIEDLGFAELLIPIADKVSGVGAHMVDRIAEALLELLYAVDYDGDGDVSVEWMLDRYSDGTMQRDKDGRWRVVLPRRGRSERGFGG